MRRNMVVSVVGLGLAAGLLPGLTGTGFTQGAGLKIGVINLKDIFDNYAKVKDFTKKLTEEGKAIEQKVELLNQQLRQLQEKLQAPGLADGPTKQDLQLQFLVAKTEQEYLVKSNTERFSRRLGEQTSEFYNEIRKKVEEISKAEGYDLVFKIDAPEVEGDTKESIVTQRINHRPLLYAREGMDFTEKVVKLLNEEYARQGGAQGAVPAGVNPPAGAAAPAAGAGAGAPAPAGAAPPK